MQALQSARFDGFRSRRIASAVRRFGVRLLIACFVVGGRTNGAAFVVGSLRVVIGKK